MLSSKKPNTEGRQKDSGQFQNRYDCSGGFGLEGFLALSNTNITRAVISSANSLGQNWNFVIDDLKFAGASIREVDIEIKPGSDPNARLDVDISVRSRIRHSWM